MLLNFRLFPLSELISNSVFPEYSEENRPGYWQLFSDGWYWINVGQTYLFRYTPEYMKKSTIPQSELAMYIQYFVSRFWEDMLELLPTVLEPLPPPLTERLSSFCEWQDWLATWNVWNEARADAIGDEMIDEEEVELRLISLRWWYERRLSTMYLISGPNIWFWNDGTSLHIGWDNRNSIFDGVAIWEDQVGQIQMPVADFLAEVSAFDQRFMEEMAARVNTARHSWKDPRFEQDLINLQEWQRQKSSALGNSLWEAENNHSTDWQRVMAAIAAVEADPLFAQMRREVEKR